MENIFLRIAKQIIVEQAVIIGPIAWEEAARVDGLQVDIKKERVTFMVEAEEAATQVPVIDALVAQYEQLFGQASVDVCRDAAQAFIAKLDSQDVPSRLR